MHTMGLLPSTIAIGVRLSWNTIWPDPKYLHAVLARCQYGIEKYALPINSCYRQPNRDY